MKRVLLLPLLLMLAGCVTYEGVDQNGRPSKFGTLIECRQSSVACRQVPQNPKDQYFSMVPRATGAAVPSSLA